MFFMTPYSVRQKSWASSLYMVTTMNNSVTRGGVNMFWRRRMPEVAKPLGSVVTAVYLNVSWREWSHQPRRLHLFHSLDWQELRKSTGDRHIDSKHARLVQSNLLGDTALGCVIATTNSANWGRTKVLSDILLLAVDQGHGFELIDWWLIHRVDR